MPFPKLIGEKTPNREMVSRERLIAFLNRIESDKITIRTAIDDGLGSLEKLYQEWLAEFETKEKTLLETKRALDSVRESLERREAELYTLQKLQAEEIKKKEDELEQRLREVRLREEKFREEAELLEGFLRRHEELCRREKVAEDLIEELDSKKRSLSIECEVLAFREDCFDQRSRELDLREAQVESKERELDSREKGLNSSEEYVKRRWKSYIFSKKQLKFQKQSFEAIPDEEPKLNYEADDKHPSADIVFQMNGKALQVFLNERAASLDSINGDILETLGLSSDPAKLVLDAMEGFYPPHLMNRGVEFEEGVVRRTCIVLLEQLFKMSPLIRSGVKAEAFRLACEWRLNMGCKLGNSLEVLAFLRLLAAYKLVTGWDANELPNLAEFVAEENAAPESCGAVGSGVHGLNFQKQVYSPVGPGNSLWRELPDSVRFALKPEKLLLDALQYSYHSALVGEGDSDLKVTRRFKTLLMKLSEASPEIENQVQLEATKLATEWKAEVIGKKCNPEDVWCFLLFLITYKSASCCGTTELLTLMKIVEKHADAINIFRWLGLKDGFPDYIDSLAEIGKQLEAIPNSHEYQLLEMVPPISPPERHRTTAREQPVGAQPLPEEAQTQEASFITTSLLSPGSGAQPSQPRPIVILSSTESTARGPRPRKFAISKGQKEKRARDSALSSSSARSKSESKRLRPVVVSCRE